MSPTYEADGRIELGTRRALPCPAKGFQTGIYAGLFPGADISTGAFNVGYLCAWPFAVYATKVFDRWCIEVTTAVASSLIRLGIYSDDGTGYPGALLLDATGAGLDSSSTGLKEATISQSLTGGKLYWAAFLTTAGASSPSTRSIGRPAFGALMGGANATEASAGTARSAWVGAGSDTTLPSTFPTTRTAGVGTIPNIYVRAA